MGERIFFEVGADARLEVIAHALANALILQLLLRGLAKTFEGGAVRPEADNGRQLAIDEAGHR